MIFWFLEKSHSFRLQTWAYELQLANQSSRRKLSANRLSLGRGYMFEGL